MRGLRQIPNLLTLSRLALAAAFPFAPAHWRLSIVAMALVTEYLDGKLSRQFHWETRLGQLLDPIADKLFFLSVALTFLFGGIFTWTDLILLGLRDIGVTIGAVCVAIRGRWSLFHKMAPQIAGKMTTFCQYLAFLSVFFAPQWLAELVIVTGLMGLVAVYQYVSSLTERRVNLR